MSTKRTSTTRTAAAAPRPLKISVFGTGYLGATHAVAMAELGFEVGGVDVDQAKVDALAAGKVPFFEPGLPELLEKNLATGRLTFTTDAASAVKDADVHFVCVGTPQQRTSHAANLSYVESATTVIARNLTKPGVVVGKSTVPVGTAARLRELVAAEAPEGVDVELVWNPEFLREGKAVNDTLHPDRIVIGGVCEAAGADVTVLADALGHDVRIGRQFLDAGLGFGGGCLPKDIRALMHRSKELGANRAAALLQQVDEINMGQRERVIDMALEACGGSVLNKRVGVLGAAFKPLTDDVRDSPALNVAAALHLRGAQVTVFDPEAGDTARKAFPTLGYGTSVDEAVEECDVLLVLTEWKQFVDADPARLATLTTTPRIIDARGELKAAQWREAGWEFTGLGRLAA